MSEPSNLISRRRFLGQSACAGLGLAGVFSTIGTLRLFNATLAAQGTPADDGKALICLFLFGGNDANNMLVPYDNAAYQAYAANRGILALPREGLLPLNASGDDGREFAFHPSMGPLQSIFNSGDLAMIANVGTLVAPITKAEYQNGGAAIPPHLFSHNDQQVQWQTSVPESRRKVGWGGRLADLLQNLNAESNISMNVSLAGNNFFQVGEEVVQYHMTPNGSIGLNEYGRTYSPVKERYAAMDDARLRGYGQIFEQEYANVFNRAIANDTLLKATFAGVPDHKDKFVRSTDANGRLNRVADQLQMILRMIEARGRLGMKRQIFFASLGGFDTHDDQLDDQAGLLGQLSAAMADFYDATEELGIRDNVTAFTASDFNRTFNSNGKGSDHAWGSHHMIMGGAVNGGRLYGRMPELVNSGPDDTGSRGSWIPAVSTDEMAAGMARWFGVSESDLPLVLPNIGRFSRTDLDFMRG